MESSDRNKFLALMSFHLLWGFVLWFSISKLGLWISTDSVHMLFGGSNLVEAGRLVSFDGSPLIQWPPLYSVLLGAVHVVTGRSTFAAAHLVQLASFAGISVCTSLLFLKIFPNDFILAFIGNILADVAVVVVSGFDLLGSDFLHLFLALLFLLLTGYYITARSPRIFTAMAVVGMLAVLDRYVGLAAILTGALSILFLSDGSLGRRLIRGCVLSASGLPAVVWRLRTAPLLEERGPLTFAENFHWFSESLTEWFLPATLVDTRPILFITLFWALVLGAVLLLFLIRHTNTPIFSLPVLCYAIVYALALFGAASLTDFNKLGGRFILPLYLPFLILLLVVAYKIRDAARRRSARLSRWISVAVFCLLSIAGLMALRISVPVILQSHAGESGFGDNAYNTAEWRDNAAIEFWLAHRPKDPYLLLSNYPDPIAFYSQHLSFPSPRQFAGPYATDEISIEKYAADLFTPTHETYLIWIKPNRHEYYYEPESLGSIAHVKRLFNSEEGAVYLLSPAPGG